jgi:hypothetical protein
MPRYKVIAPGFHNKMLYHPEGTGKRNFLDRDKPFSKDEMPSWLEPVKESKKADLSVDRDVVKAAMKSMIEKKEGLSADGVPNMAPLQKIVKIKVGQDLRDELMTEIELDEQNAINLGQGTSFLDKESKIETL